MNELTSVPKISGSAPNWFVTGFHCDVHRNAKPNLASDADEPLTSDTKSSVTSSTNSPTAA